MRVRLPAFLLLGLFGCQQQGAAIRPATEDLVVDEIEVFVREGCPHCTDAKAWLDELDDRYPTLEIAYLPVDTHPEARSRLQEIARKEGLSAAGVPTFVVGDEVIVGFRQPETAERIEALLTGEQAGAPIRLPLVGELRPDRLGLPLFTVALGLVDGFNPCAMWVLLFLLSMLVHLESRPRMLLVAGTFVLVSGLLYFAFMAAWLNAFLLVGYTRAVQVVLGLVAFGMGAIHVKDFFALGKGISLSIPASAKPGIMARIRRILRAENLLGALLGVVGLAVLVNIVELLCTAGLPALYTQVLTAQALPAGQYYGWLAVYNLFYMLDDGLMVAVAVITLSRSRLQEKGGRYLKLLSGLVMAALGLSLLFWPEWLVW